MTRVQLEISRITLKTQKAARKEEDQAAEILTEDPEDGLVPRQDAEPQAGKLIMQATPSLQNIPPFL